MALIQIEELRYISKDVIPLIAKNGSAAFQSLSRSPEEVLETLIRTCEDPHLRGQQKSAAFGALAGFLEKGAASPDLQTSCIRNDVFERCLGIFLSKYDGYSAKPIRQLLLTLVRILAIQDKKTSQSCRHEMTRRSLDLILDHDDPSSVKPAMMVLDLLLSRKCLSPVFIISTLRETQHGMHQSGDPSSSSASEQLFIAQVFIQHILDWATLSNLAQSAGHLLSTFCALFKSLSFDVPITQPIWLLPVRTTLGKDQSDLEMIERYVLPTLLRTDAMEVIVGLNTILEQLHSYEIASLSETDIRFCLIVLKCGRGTLNASDFKSLRGTTVASSDQSKPPLVEMVLLRHSSHAIRFAALDLLVSAYQLPAHIPSFVLESVLRHASVFHAETDPQARNLLVSIMQKLLGRIQISILRLEKDLDGRENARVAGRGRRHLVHDRDLEAQISFSRRYFAYLSTELQPTSSYQRHITALKVLKLFYSFGLHTKIGCIAEEVVQESLFNLVMDAFDDVRAAAVALLEQVHGLHLQSNSRQISISETVDAVLERSKIMLLNSGRADFADGYGRLQRLYFVLTAEPFACMQQLLANLKNGLAVAKESLNRAVDSAPIHGELIALRYICDHPKVGRAFLHERGQEEWTQFHHSLEGIFADVWSIVHPVLCIDSPEGQTFIEDDEVDIGIKDTLSYSWRALKEASSLKQALVSNEAYGHCSPTKSLTSEQLETMGRLACTQLAELRHRGAFSTVAHAFAACCAACGRSSEASARDLPHVWYKETLACISDKAGALTRRSAGLPSMMMGILMSWDTELVNTALKELQHLARQPIERHADKSSVRLPQVHALNCLKEICTNTKLGPMVEPHLESMIMLASECLESDVWAIRNCGMMLFKSILSRLTSGSGSDALRQSNKHRRYAKATYDKFPTLSRFLLRLLENSTGSDRNISLSLRQELGFPAIQMIERIGVLPKDRDPVTDLLRRRLDTSNWIVRENAANALSSLLNPEQLVQAINDSLEHPIMNNRLHGHLLALHFSLERQQGDDLENAQDLLSQLLKCSNRFLCTDTSPYVKSSYVKAVLALVKRCLVFPAKSQSDSRYEMGILDQALVIQLQELSNMITRMGLGDSEASLRESLFQLHLIIDGQQSADRSFFLFTLRFLQILDAVGNKEPRLKALPITFDNLTQSIVQDIFAICKASFLSQDDASTSASAQVLVDILGYYDEDIGYHVRHRTKLFFQLDEMLEVITSKTPENESIANSFLVLKGALLPWLCPMQPNISFHVRQELVVQWGWEVFAALDERADVSTRIAAAQSIWHHKRGLGFAFNKAGSGRIVIATALAAALVDDDEEVRGIAAKTVSYIVSEPCYKPKKTRQTYQLHPIAARTFLNGLICNIFHSENWKWSIGIHSILGLPLWATESTIRYPQSGPTHHEEGQLRFLSTISATDVFKQSLANDNSLFVEERQNQFADEVEEAAAWVNILKAPQNISELESTTTHLLDWLEKGFKTWTEYARTHHDGPLGWSTKREAFVTGMRFLSLAELILATDFHAQIVLSLEHLFEIGKGKDLNKHWMWKIEQILDAYRDRKVASVVRTLTDPWG